MKRSEINQAVKRAARFFKQNGWTLPPAPRWDVTDFGLGDFQRSGLLLVNLAEEEEYCEKLMYAKKDQETPLHYHKRKKEDIICRTGKLAVHLWSNTNGQLDDAESVFIKLNGNMIEVEPGQKIVLEAGWRVTLVPYVWHKFYPESDECIIGEVSTANDDLNDNFFDNPDIGRYSCVEEDEPALVKILSDKH